MEAEKYITLWKKYLPVIRIQIKKSLQKEEQIKLNKIEFEAVGDRDRASYTFNLEIEKGKVTNDISGTAVARDLYKVLIADKIVKDFLSDKKIKIGLGKAFNLKLKAASA